MSKPRVLITTYYLKPGDEIDRMLLDAGMETVHSPWTGKRTEEEMIEALKGIDGCIASSDPFTAKVLATTDRLRIIARTGAGYDTIDMKAATAKGIAVCTTPGANRHAVSEYAFTLMLNLARKIKENLNEVTNGGWVRHEGIDLAGRTLGIIGLGTIGKETAQRAKAFEMKILAHDLFQDQVFADAFGITYVPLEDLLKQSDFVTMHCSLDATNYHVINAERLAMMKPTAYLINTARGGLIDAEALYQALKEKKIAGAALDVVEREPLEANSPLRELDNILLSPHAAGSSSDGHWLSPLMATQDVIMMLKGERPAHPLNREVLG